MRHLLVLVLLAACLAQAGETDSLAPAGEQTLPFKITILDEQPGGTQRRQVRCRLTFEEAQRYLPLSREDWARMARMELVHYFRVVVVRSMA